MSMDRLIAGSLNDLNLFMSPAYSYSSLPRFLPRSVSQEGFNARNEHWYNVQTVVVGLFQRKALPSNSLHGLVEDIRALLKTDIGPVLIELYQNQLIKKGMVILRESVKNLTGDELLKELGDLWDEFFTDILPTLEAIFHLLQPAKLSIRQLTLKSFRDIIVLKTKLRETLIDPNTEVPPSITQMFLVLLCVHGFTAPDENYMRLERLAARVVCPMLGFDGFYTGDVEPVLRSNCQRQPSLHERSKSADDILGRESIKRPSSLQILPNPYQLPLSRRPGSMNVIPETSKRSSVIADELESL